MYAHCCRSCRIDTGDNFLGQRTSLTLSIDLLSRCLLCGVDHTASSTSHSVRRRLATTWDNGLRYIAWRHAAAAQRTNSRAYPAPWPVATPLGSWSRRHLVPLRHRTQQIGTQLAFDELLGIRNRHSALRRRRRRLMTRGRSQLAIRSPSTDGRSPGQLTKPTNKLSIGQDDATTCCNVN